MKFRATQKLANRKSCIISLYNLINQIKNDPISLGPFSLGHAQQWSLGFPATLRFGHPSPVGFSDIRVLAGLNGQALTPHSHSRETVYETVCDTPSYRGRIVCGIRSSSPRPCRGTLANVSPPLYSASRILP